MKKKIIIFGAGRTGRGFVAHLAHRAGFAIVLVDKDCELVGSLARTGCYRIHVLADNFPGITISPEAVYHVDDTRWHEEMPSASLLACSVFGNHLAELAVALAGGLAYRYRTLPGIPLDLITCENYTGAAELLKNKIIEQFDDPARKWLHEMIGFSESMILSTCLSDEDSGDPLAIRAQDFFEWPCDAEGFKRKIPRIPGLKPLSQFSNQLRRKIYTYNCINAVITYLGAQKGYTLLHKSAGDPGINRIARKAATEASGALIAEFGFDRKEQDEWVEAAFAKFTDPRIPDPIERNGADPVRKLGREDRLTGPALLALRHRIRPDGIIRGIVAGFDFYDSSKKLSVGNLINSRGLEPVLEQVCGLHPEEELYDMVRTAYEKQKAGE